MRIAVCIATDHDGGAERYLVMLFTELQRRNLATAHLFGRLAEWDDAGLESTAVPCGPKWGLRTIARSIRAARRERRNFVEAVTAEHQRQPFDVIHMQYKREQILLSRPLSRLAPVVWTEHAPLQRDFAGRVIRAMYRRASRSVVAVIGVSEATAASAADATHPGTTSTTIDNSVDTDRFHPPTNAERAAARSELRLRHDSRVAASICRLHPHKRVERSITLLQNVNDLEFVIGGSGPAQASLAEIAGHGVQFVGWVDDPAPVYRAADFAVINAAPREGLMLSLLEAAASGCAIVGFIGDPVADAVSAAGGLLVEPGAELDEDLLFGDLDRRRRDARAWAAERGLGPWVDRHLSVFDSARSDRL